MKRVILSTALTLALAGSAAFAQQTLPAPSQDAQTSGAPMHRHFRHHPDPQRQAEFISKKLNLSPDQAAKLAPIFADRDQKFQALRQNSSLTPEQRHEQMKAIHESMRQQLANVLTPDQLQQLKSMRHNHRGFGPHGPRGEGQAQAPASPSGL